MNPECDECSNVYAPVTYFESVMTIRAPLISVVMITWPNPHRSCWDSNPWQQKLLHSEMLKGNNSYQVLLTLSLNIIYVPVNISFNVHNQHFLFIKKLYQNHCAKIQVYFFALLTMKLKLPIQFSLIIFPDNLKVKNWIRSNFDWRLFFVIFRNGFREGTKPQT